MASTNQKKSQQVAAGSSKTTRKRTTSHKKKNQDRYDGAMLREIIILAALATAAFLLLSNFGFCGKIGQSISHVMFGMFGIMAYVFPIFLFLGIAFFISNLGRSKAYIKLTASVFAFMFTCMLLQMVFFPFDKETTLSQSYDFAVNLKVGGGWIGALLSAMLIPYIGVTGGYLFAVVIVIAGMVLMTERSFLGGVKKHGSKVYRAAVEDAERIKEANRIRQDEKRTDLRAQRADRKIRGVALSEIRDDSDDLLEEEVHEITAEYQDDLPVSSDTKAFSILRSLRMKSQESDVSESSITYDSYKTEEIPNEDVDDTDGTMSVTDRRCIWNNSESEYKPDTKLEQEIAKLEEHFRQEDPFEEEISLKHRGLFDEDSYDIQDQKHSQQEYEEIHHTYKEDSSTSPQQAESHLPQESIVISPNPYQFPPVSLLAKASGRQSSKKQEAEIQETAIKLQNTLQSFGVRVTVTEVSQGPSVTRYELSPEQGVKVSKIVALADDIKLNLAAADIRIEAPIPGKAAVGIEVPNKENSTVMFRELLENKEFTQHPSSIAFAVGKDIGGKAVVTDIAKMPHLLIAGATGSGKSVCINTLIMSILYKADPSEVKMIMVDPKVVELSVYNGIPHLLIPVVTDPKKAAGALNWAVVEMTDRYKKFAELNVRDLKGYNEKIASIKHLEGEDKPEKLPQIVIIVDELADLMMVAPGEVEDAICRLAQMARAAGLHLVIATQRPSVNVITGLIKANVPSRIAFSVSSGVDSRTIIDMNGAEKLLGKGDMLFYPSGYQKPVRVQGAFISDKEVAAVVGFLAEQAKDQYVSQNQELSSKLESSLTAQENTSVETDSNRDAYFIEAGRFMIEKDKASIGLLQRMFKIGFNRASRIMDQLGEAGVVGPEEGTKPRKVLMNMDEFEAYIVEGK